MNVIQSDQPDAAIVLAGVFAGGGVAVTPTDTIYGLSAALSSRRGYQRIIEIKESKPGRQFLYLAGSAEMVRVYIDSWGCASREDISAIWPAPLTGVFRAGEKCPEWIEDTIAFRVPALELLRETINMLGEPVISTSVNTSSEPPLYDIEQIESRFGKSVDLVVRGKEARRHRPSTIVDFTGSRPIVVRRGAYAWMDMGKPSN
ncbi:MAG: L-threonylcarbamoyladenylate synthase [bacterium]